MDILNFLAKIMQLSDNLQLSGKNNAKIGYLQFSGKYNAKLGYFTII